MLDHFYEPNPLPEFGHAVRSRDQLPSNNALKYTSGYIVSSHTPGNDVELSVRVTVEEDVKVDYDQDIADGLSKHRGTSARIEQEYRRREERRKHGGEETVMTTVETDDESQKGWQVTSIGKIFSP